MQIHGFNCFILFDLRLELLTPYLGSCTQVRTAACKNVCRVMSSMHTVQVHRYSDLPISVFEH